MVGTATPRFVEQVKSGSTGLLAVSSVDVRSAIENDAIAPFFQPLVELRSGRLTGFEVLARWLHPDLGPILPPTFISLAEESGLMGAMTRTLLRKAFQAAVRLPQLPRLGVNISPIQFRQRALISEIRDAAEEGQFPLGMLTIEITESALLGNLEAAREIACELKAMGCRLALDDFGTGFSSLLHLQTLPFDLLKVDRSFIAAMIGNRGSRKIVAAVLGLGHSLGVKTVAEGVETEEQAEMLLRLGCTMGQGWLYGRPSGAELLSAIFAAPPREVCVRPDPSGEHNMPICLQAMPVQQGSQLHAIYEGAPVGLCFLDTNLRYVSINHRLAEMNGATIQAHLGRTPQEMVPALFPKFAPYLYRALQGERISDLEIERTSATSREVDRVLLVSYQPAFDEAGEVIGVSVAATDITELKRAEQVLRESDERYRSIMETSPAALWVLDSKGDFIDASSPWYEMTGQTREECEQKGFMQAVHPDDQERCWNSLSESLRSGKLIDIEFRAVAAEGGWRWMRVSGAPRYGDSGEIVRWYGTAEDINDRRNLESICQPMIAGPMESRSNRSRQERDRKLRELAASDARFRAFLDASPVSAFIKDEEGRMIYCNRALADRFGATPEEWIGKTDLETWPPEIAEEFRSSDRQALEANQEIHFEDRTRGLDGRLVTWDVHKYPFVDADGRRSIACMALDVTRAWDAQQEVQRIQQELQTANERLQTLSLTDALTGLMNRRALEDCLENECARSIRSAAPLSLFMLDIDDFKGFNDTFGHVCGDDVLRQIAVLMQQWTRRGDLVARYGGEEFLVILPATDENAAFGIAERLHHAITGADWKHRLITVSVGVATRNKHIPTTIEFIHEVDQALYAAKRGGKNRVCQARSD